MNYKELGIKIGVAFIAGALLELSLTQSFDWKTLLSATLLGGSRGLINFIGQYKETEATAVRFSWKEYF